jgi:hypothetical protein
VRRIVAIGVALLALIAADASAAQQPSLPADQQPVMLVVDVSGSMDEDDGTGTRKIDGAKLALLDYLGSVEPGSPIGLRTFPDQATDNCNSGRLQIGVGPADPAGMSATIRKLSPDGDTPTAEAMRRAVQDLKDEGYSRGTLVIVSDGQSTCDDPCKAAQDIADEGFDLDAITVGFKISEDGRKQLECISDALGGRYLDSDQSDELRDTLDRLGRPQLEVAIQPPVDREVIAGGEAVTVSATVTNTGEVEARNAIAQLTLRDQTGVDVQRPVSHLGNLAPQASRVVTWQIRADASTASRTLPFTVVGRALNASAVGEAAGSLRSVGVTRIADAGEILKGPGRRIAILGDSFSAGEGADQYEAGTDDDANGCHRSPLSYLIPLVGRAEIEHFACSGALTDDVLTPNEDQTQADGDPERAQIDSLERAQGDDAAKAVVMTIGGNDAGFDSLAKSCVAGRKSCTDTIYPGLPTDLSTSISRKDFVDQHVGPSSLVANALVSTYESVNQALNSKDIVKRRGGRLAPILVLGYVLPIPLQGRSCAPMGSYTVVLRTMSLTYSRTFYLLSADEIDFLAEFALQLNGIVESAVETARRERGVPVFYVPSTESAFQPNHTLCDSAAPFARATNSFNGGALNADNLITLADSSVSPRAVVRKFLAAKNVGERGLQELAHPNAKGYAAETQALLRWTRSRAATDAVAFTRTAQPAKPVATSWNVSQLVLGASGGDARQLEGGTTYPVQAQGFAPNSAVRIEVHSRPRLLAKVRADGRGRVSTRVGIPHGLAGGDHDLRVIGSDPSNRPHTVTIRFTVDRGMALPSTVQAMGLAAALLLLSGLLLLAVTGELRRARRWITDVPTAG